MEHVLLKEGRKWETWSGIFHPQSIISHQQHGLPWPACTTCQPGQVPEAINLLLFQATWSHSVLHGYNHLDTVFVSSIGLADIYSTHRNLY